MPDCPPLPASAQIAVQEGPLAFYRGCLVNAVKVVPGAAIQFVG